MTSATSVAGTGQSSVGGLPDHVAVLIAFTNSVDHDEGTDDLTTPPELTQWLFANGLLERRSRSTAADLTLARQLRDGLHEAMCANHDGTSGSPSLELAAAELPLQLSSPDQPVLRPVHDGVKGALSRLLVAVNSAVGDGTWPRLKICSADDCAWAYFDTTKNRSRAWCEWGCGNRVKTRNYRARKKAMAP